MYYFTLGEQRQNAEKQRDSEKQGRKEAERLNVVLQKEVDELRKELRMKEEQLRQQQEKASEVTTHLCFTYIAI